MPSNEEIIAALVAKARIAQKQVENYTQEQIDEVALSVAWQVYKDENIAVCARTAVDETGKGRLRGQAHQAQGQGLRRLPRHQARQDRRRDRSRRGPRTHQIRQAGRRRRGPHPGDQPDRHPGQQRDRDPQGPQRRHLRPAPGGQELLPRGVRLHARGSAQGRRPGRPGPVHRRAERGAQPGAHAPGRPRARHRRGGHGQVRLFERHALLRRRGRQPGHHRGRGRGAGGCGREDPHQQILRQRHLLQLRQLAPDPDRRVRSRWSRS